MELRDRMREIILALSLLVSDSNMVSSSWNPTEVAQYISQSAIARGIDPATAVAVARTEGLNNPVGDAGHSFGPFQLYTGGQGFGGGLGNSFQTATGLNPANFLQNWQQQVDYFLNFAAQSGWNPGGVGLGSSYVAGTGGGSHGASSAGIANRQGLSGAHTLPIGSGVDTSTIIPDIGGGVTDTGGTTTDTGVTTGVTGENQTTANPTVGTTANAGGVPPPPTGLNLSFGGSIQHLIFQFLLVLLGIALLLGGVYLIGSKK